jgi:hypothetical protein
LLTTGRVKECAGLLEKHLDDSESRLLRVMNSQMAKKTGKRKS